MADENQQEANEEKYHDKKSWLEWVVFGVGLSLTLSILGYLTYRTINYDYGPPELRVEYFPEPGRHEPHRYHLLLHNDGPETAETITIELLFERDSQVVERATLAVDYCPQGSIREGWVAFNDDPATADTIKARIVGYEKP